MAGKSGKFGRKHEDAIAALLTQRNVEEAARTSGIGTRTLLRWMQLPEFQTAYRQARREAFGQAVARLQQGASAAATTLLKTMVDASTPHSVRVRAAECILNHAMKAIELEDIEARLADLGACRGNDKSAMTNLQRRVQKLERTEILKRHLPLLEQLKTALNDAAVRLTGKDFTFVQGDELATVRAMNEVRDSFLEKLNDADLASLISELEPIAFGDDTAALEAARREAVRAADEEFGCVSWGR